MYNYVYIYKYVIKIPWYPTKFPTLKIPRYFTLLQSVMTHQQIGEKSVVKSQILMLKIQVITWGDSSMGGKAQSGRWLENVKQIQGELIWVGDGGDSDADDMVILMVILMVIIWCMKQKWSYVIFWHDISIILISYLKMIWGVWHIWHGNGKKKNRGMGWLVEIFYGLDQFPMEKQ